MPRARKRADSIQFPFWNASIRAIPKKITNTVRFGKDIFCMYVFTYTLTFSSIFEKMVLESACLRPYRLTVRTRASQALNPGSIPGRVTSC